MSNFLGWLSNNKTLVVLGLLVACLFVSTLALAVHNHNLRHLLNYNMKCHRDQPQNLEKFQLRKINNVMSYRLPRHIVPVQYELILRPNIMNKTFDGEVAITVKILNATKRITLHSNKLNISSINLETSDKNERVIIKSTDLTKDKREFLYVDTENPIKAGNYRLYIKYSGRLDKELVGFYASTLKKGGTMVASKFQPTYARQAFPCFDEPDFKATFDITLVKPKSYVALSNMNEVSKNLQGSLEAVKFATTVPMSTYLACFVICDFDFKEVEVDAKGIGKNFKLRSFAQKDQMHKIDFAQDIGKRVTEYYINYYEVPFPLPKLDMIAIPDYISGATEHWGLITYRETSFLIDQAISSSRNKYNVANTIAHELAHMWFGNLVTMKWWDELWLNEGFATYMQVKALNAIEPSWSMLDQFVIKTLHPVMITDAKLSSHPIVQNVTTPDEITAIFDSISYSKGASVLRMLEGFVGAETFRLGVSQYLQKHEFGNTGTQDLLAALEPQFSKNNPGLNLTHIVSTWTRQAGYPSVHVTSRGRTLRLTQSRFLLDPRATYQHDTPYKYRWFIPITYKTNKGPHKDIIWFPEHEESIEIELQEDHRWFKINNEQIGYYRVNYTIEQWENLIRELNTDHEQFSQSDRAQLVSDSFALATAGTLPYTLALRVLAAAARARDYVTWASLVDVYHVLADRLQNTPAIENLKKMMQSLVKSIYAEQTWDSTELIVVDGLLRRTVLSLATSCGVREAESRARRELETWLEAHRAPAAAAPSIAPDLRDLVYYYGMKSASVEDWNNMWEIYMKEEDVQEQNKLRKALTAPRNPEILSKYLSLAWDERAVRAQDYLGVLQELSRHPAGARLVWDHVRAHWPDLVARYSLNSRYLGNLIPAITRNFDSELKIEEMEAFFKKYPEAGAGSSARARALETARHNVLWARDHRDALSAWLVDNYP